jgi:hypothetical protein
MIGNCQNVEVAAAGAPVAGDPWFKVMPNPIAAENQIIQVEEWTIGRTAVICGESELLLQNGREVREHTSLAVAATLDVEKIRFAPELTWVCSRELLCIGCDGSQKGHNV